MMFVYVGPFNVRPTTHDDLLKVDSASWYGMLHAYGLQWQLPELVQALKSIKALVIDTRIKNAFKEYRPVPYGYEGRSNAGHYYEWLFTKVNGSRESDVIIFFTLDDLRDV